MCDTNTKTSGFITIDGGETDAMNRNLFPCALLEDYFYYFILKLGGVHVTVDPVPACGTCSYPEHASLQSFAKC